MMEQRAKYVAKAKKIALEPDMEEKPRKSGGGRVSTRKYIQLIYSELEIIIIPPSPLLLLGRHIVFILSSCPSQTIVCMCNYSYVLEENSLNLCMLPYYHMENRYRILIKPFLKELFSFLFFLFFKYFIKIYVPYVFPSKTTFHWFLWKSLLSNVSTNLL